MLKIARFWPLFTLHSKSVHMIFGQNSPKYQVYSLTFCWKLHDFGHFSLSTQNQSTWFLAKIRQNTKCIALLFAENCTILATFHSPLKINVDWFWVESEKLHDFVPLFTLNSKSGYPHDILAKIRQNTKCIALLLSREWKVARFCATFHSPLKSQAIHMIFWPKFGQKSCGLILSGEWKVAKIVQFCSKSKAIHLVFWPLFTLHSKSCPHDFLSQNSPKYQVYSLTFCSYNCTYFGHFSLSTQNHVPHDFELRVKIRQNTCNFQQKVSLYFFAENCTILATFHSPLKIMSTWFWVESENSPKYQVYSLTFCSYNWHDFGHFSLSTQNHVHWFWVESQNSPKYVQVYEPYFLLIQLHVFWPLFTLHSKSCPHDFWRSKIRQNTKCIALLFADILARFWPLFTLHSKSCPHDFWPKFAKIPSV